MTTPRLPPSHRRALETLEDGGWLEIDEARVRAATVSTYEGDVRVPRNAGAVVVDRNDYGRRMTTAAWHTMRDQKWIVKQNGSWTHTKWKIAAAGRQRLKTWREHGGGRRHVKKRKGKTRC